MSDEVVEALIRERERHEQAMSYLQTRLANGERKRRERFGTIGQRIQDGVNKRTAALHATAYDAVAEAQTARAEERRLAERFGQVNLALMQHFQHEHGMNLMDASAAARELTGESE